MDPKNTSKDKFGEKILIITSDSFFGKQLQEILGRGGYNVSIVEDGKEAMKSIIDSLPHIILLDIVLSGEDSYDLLKEKQNEPMLAKIPVFLLSTQGIPINISRVPNNSVKEFIVAIHADPEAIMTKIDKYLGHIRPQDTTPADFLNDKRKVLWVEDDKLIGNILGKKFTSSGFELVHTKNGEDTIKELEHFVPDVVVVDLLLPGMSGFDILQYLKTKEKFNKVPVMVLSNLSKPSDIERARILGAKKFLVKAAVSLDQIIAEVHNLSLQ
ncbi:MAG: response regulator [Candidatus Paceibacterota bacterium]|jgi:DNA-binding response OmpR family regulator